MYTLNDLKEMRVYRGRRISFARSGNEDRRRGTAVIVLSPDPLAAALLAHSPLLADRRFLRSAYSPLHALATHLRARHPRFNQAARYKALRASVGASLTAHAELSAYKDMDLIYDLSEQIAALATLKVAPLVRTRTLAETIEAAVAELSAAGYGEVMAYVPLEAEITDLPTELNSVCPPSVVASLYTMSKRKVLPPGSLGQVKFLVHDPQSGAVFKFTGTPPPGELQMLRTALSALNKIKKGEELTEEEKKAVEEPAQERVAAASGRTPSVERAAASRLMERKIAEVTGAKTGALTPEARAFAVAVAKSAPRALVGEALPGETEEETERRLETDVNFLEHLEEVKREKLNGKRAELQDERSARLRAGQEKVSIGGLTLDGSLKDWRSRAIETHKVPVISAGENLRVSKLRDFDSSYVAHQSDADLARILSAFSDDPEVKVFVKDFKREDTSDSFNKKETLTVTFEDSLGTRHNFKLDVPVVIRDKFMFLNGTKKTLTKQITKLPVTKMRPDTVEITTNYDKVILTRFGSGASSDVKRLERWSRSLPREGPVSARFGDNRGANSVFRSSLEYDEISSFLAELKVGGWRFLFNRTEADALGPAPGPGQFLVASGPRGEFLVCRAETGECYPLSRTGEDPDGVAQPSIVKSIGATLRAVSPEAADALWKSPASLRLAYTRMNIISRKFPLGVTLGFYAGLQKVLADYGVPYEFSEKRKPGAERQSEIQFSDGWLYYPSSPLRYSLLLNGLSELPTKDHTFAEFGGKDAYLEYFGAKFGSRNVAKGLENKLSLMVDPITREILGEMGLPQDIVGLLLYANTLLESQSSRKQNDLSNYRIRGAEQINAYIYYTMATAFKTYKDALKAGNRSVRMTVPRGQLLRTLQESPMLENYSTLNPVLEAEKMGSCTFKGLSGTNVDSNVNSVSTSE
jgi:hypothetical protein